MGVKMNACRMLVEKPGGNNPLGRRKRRWVVNITIDLTKIGWSGTDWIELAEDRNLWRSLFIHGNGR
jgi:hypothetical protein